jgi:hypothetical protein
MENTDFRRLLVAMASLSMVMVVLVLGAILFMLLLYNDPSWFATERQTTSETQTPLLEDEIKDGVHLATGFVEGEGLQLVIANCTNCHSAKLVTQNRFTKEGWTNVIRWMQETQQLWDLGANEEAIVAYLSTYYAPEARGRRKPLEVEWYELD